MSSSPFQLKSDAEFVKPKFQAEYPAGSPRDASASSTSICGRSAGDRGDHQDAVSLLKFVVVAAEKANVFLVHVNIHEAPHLPGVVAQMLGDRGKTLLDFAEQIRQRLRTALNGLHAVRKSPQR